MSMETRRARIQAGTLKPKAQARADREARTKGDNDQKTTAGNIQPVIFDAKAADEKFHARLLQDLVDEKISMDEMKELKLKGRPPEINSNQTATKSKTWAGGCWGWGGHTSIHTTTGF